MNLMASSAAISEAFQNLLASDNSVVDIDGDEDGDGDEGSICSRSVGSSVAMHPKSEYQGHLCGLLAQALLLNSSSSGSGSGSGIDTSTSTSTSSLRDVLGDQASALGPLVGPLLQDRVALQELLPATQDVQANDEVLDDQNSAQTLTLTAVQAAWLYAKALSLPGALGSGLVDLEWLAALTALVRRWALECCGREQEIIVAGKTMKAISRARPDKHPAGNTSKSKSKSKSHTKSPPKKRTRRHQTTGTAPMELSSDTSDDEEQYETTTTTTSTKQNILQIGLQVALAVCDIPCQKEFAAWSFEAREAVLDALCASFGAAAALQSTMLQHPHQEQLCSKIVTRATEALQSSLTYSKSGKSNKHTSGSTRQHETAVLACRGMLHLLQFKEILPNGEKGKLDAQAAAAGALQEMMEGFTRSSLNESRGRRSSLGDATNQQQQQQNAHTPARRRRRSSGGLTTPATTVNGKTPRRRRTSVEIPGTDGKGRGGGGGRLTPISSPALKGRRSSFGTVGVTPSATSLQHSKPRPVWSVFVGLLQKLATTQGLERASTRGPTVDALVLCVPALPLAERAHFLRYLLKLSKSKVSLHRLVASELVGRILAQDWLAAHQDDTVEVSVNHLENMNGCGRATPAVETPSSTGSHDDGTMALPNALWKALQGRLVDKLAAVRARAATSIETATAAHPDWLEEPLLLSLRKRALRDETATVRKAAVLALKQVLLSQEELLSEIYIATFCELCQDSSLLTRKAAAEAITSLLEAYLDHPTVGSLLEQAWSTCVLPMVLDEEVASKAIGSLDQVVVVPLLLSIEHGDHQQPPSATRTAAAWRLLAHVANSSSSQGASKGARQALQTALRQMTLEDSDRIQKDLWKLTATVARESLDDPETSEAQVVGVWCLLEALLLSAVSSKQVKTMVKTLQKRSSSSTDLQALCGSSWKVLLERCGQAPRAWLRGTLKSCLCVVSQLAPGLDPDSAQQIHDDLQEEVRNLHFSPEVIGGAIGALSSISIRLDPVNAQTLCSHWMRRTYQSCEDEMAHSVKFSDDLNYSADRQQRLVRALFCVGELSMVGFRVDDDEKDAGKKHTDDDKLRGMHEQPSKRLQELVQSLLPPTLPGSSSGAATTTTETPTTIRAHAFTVLGKLCLRDETLAKNSLNIFARELHPSAPNPRPAVQSNALLVLGDLCVRYTNMADRYLPVMASCLQSGASDPETNLLQSNTNGFAITRKHAVLLLSSLLLQDYIKWRGLLFHRFLVACSDENEEVATLAESVLSGPLSTRNPKLFFNHFVEALFVLNKCTAHPIYISAANQGDGGSGIAVGFEGIYLNGELGRLRRRRMYDFLLSKLSDEEKIGVTARLAKEVLGEAVSSDGDLGRVCQTSNQEFGPKLQSAWNVLIDAFSILTSKAIRVGKTIQEDDSIMDDPNVPNPTRQVSLAKNRLLTKISRKHLIEIVLPILCNLKTKLQASCSPLLKELMTYLLDIFKSYRTEVKEFLANDPTLLQEIEYDARQHAVQQHQNIEA